MLVRENIAYGQCLCSIVEIHDVREISERVVHFERFLTARVDLKRVRNGNIGTWLNKHGENIALMRALYDRAVACGAAGATLAEMEVS